MHGTNTKKDESCSCWDKLCKNLLAIQTLQVASDCTLPIFWQRKKVFVTLEARNYKHISNTQCFRSVYESQTLRSRVKHRSISSRSSGYCNNSVINYEPMVYNNDLQKVWPVPISTASPPSCAADPKTLTARTVIRASSNVILADTWKQETQTIRIQTKQTRNVIYLDRK